MIPGISHDFNEAVKRQPALRFELQTGLSGIAGRYVFPKGFTAAEFEDHYTWRFDSTVRHPGIVIEQKMDADRALMESTGKRKLDDLLECTTEDFQTELKSAWNELVRLNPPLAKVEPQKMVDYYHAILGVVSGFNIDDIMFFQKGHRKVEVVGKWAQTFADIRSMTFEIETETGYSLSWVPSRKTLKRVMKQVELRRQGL